MGLLGSGFLESYKKQQILQTSRSKLVTLKEDARTNSQMSISDQRGTPMSNYKSIDNNSKKTTNATVDDA